MRQRVIRHLVCVAAALAALAALAPALAHAQAASQVSAQVAAMQPLARWVGEWRGTGWSLDQTGKRTEFTLVETVAPRVGGTVLLIEGHGTATGADAGRITHDGLVVLHYDARARRYVWDGHDVGFGAMSAEATVDDGRIAWSWRPAPGGPIVRFTITFDEQRWHETGEASADGQAWSTFMEMTLTRR